MSLSLCCCSVAYESTEQRYEPTTEGESDKGTMEEASAIESQENK